MTWAHYILQVNIYLVVFYGFYKLLLDKETYFLLNRIYLVAAGIFSLAIPFIRFEWFSTQPAVQPVYTGVVQTNDFITQMTVIKDDPNRLNIGSILVMIYLVGALFFGIRFIAQLISVQILLRKKKSGSAFSFFKKKVIDQNLPQVQTIQKHEEIHIRQWHTLDVLFFELVGIITWLNPVIYFYKATVKHIHEYLADEEAATFQGDKEEYALLLLSSAFGVPANALTNSFFNKSLIKKRIYMLHKQRSRKTAILKYGMFLPLFAVALIMSSATIRNNKEIKKIAEKIPLEEPLKVVKEAVIDAINTDANKQGITPKVLLKPATITKSTETKADTDWTDFYNHLKRTIRYPAAAQEKNIQGNTQVRFIVKDGKVEDINTVTALGYGCDEELKRCISTYPNFKSIPDGNYTINSQFKLSYDTTPSVPVEFKNQNLPALKDYVALNEVVVIGYVGKSSSSNNDNSKVYDFVSLDQQPSFPGGMQQFYEYLKKSVKYPQEAQKNRIEGKVYLSFIVETDGELSDITVMRGVGSGLDEEAVRVIKESPKWIPGVQNNKKVRVKYNIPIAFHLSPQQANSGNTQTAPQNNEKVFDFVSLETQPSFPGGMEKFYEFLKKTVKYPKEAQDKNIQGKVFVSMVVEKDGTLTDIKVDRKLGGGTDEEAVRVLKASPKWVPGVQQGQKVRVKYNIPISFTLSK
nr:TonB family protein [Pedobacter panaciterrae]